MKACDAIVLCYILTASHGFEKVAIPSNHSIVPIEGLLGLTSDGQQMTKEVVAALKVDKPSIKQILSKHLVLVQAQIK